MRAKVVSTIRKTLFEKITQLDYSFFHHERKGKLMSYLSNDIGEIENSVVSSIQVVFREPLLIIGYLIVLFILSPQLTWFTVIVLPVSGFLIATLTKRLRRDAKEGQQLLGDLLSIIEETISGVRIIKAFNAEKQINNRFGTLNDRYSRMLRRMWNRKELATPTSEVLGVGLVVCVLLYGGILVLNGTGDFTASKFITYIAIYSQILTPAKNISGAVSNIQRGLISAEQIFKIIDVPVKIKDHPNAQALTEFNDKIEYKGVFFSYLREENGYVLKDINLTIGKGKTIALVGQSGSGKTTLAEMLPRFYDLEKGEILLDGKNIKDYRLRDLREQMGVVNQESILFNDTVFNNIAFGKPEASLEEIMNAARIANAHEFISQMPEGYQTNIGDRGGKLSGGQRQRISIARAVLKNPPILILDEATSALDTESERLVQDALTSLMKNRTTLVIAHRLSTIQHADEIIVMQQGVIIERGCHDELLARTGVYRKLYDLQSFV
jgi:ATP-binding cassette, subfamily B, bacterial MsbA